MDEFDKKLVAAIEETLMDTLGELNVKIIFGYLERNISSKQEITYHLEDFCQSLERIIGSGHGKILGTSAILEGAIAERLARKLGKKCCEPKPISLCAYVKKLRNEYCLEQNKLK